MTQANQAEEVDLGITFEEEIDNAINNDTKEGSAPHSEDAPAVEIPKEQAIEPSDEELSKRAQTRINKVTADKWDEKRRADELQAELDTLKTQSVIQKPSAAPKLEDFDFDEEAHQSAMIDYKVDQKVNQKAESIQKQQQDSQKEEAKANATKKFADNCVTFAADKADFNEVLGRVPTLQPSVLDELMSRDNGPQLAYFLGTHADIADQIISMNPVAAGIKIGEISRKLAEPKQIKPSSAPEPIDPLTSGGTTATERGPTGATFE